MTDLLQVLPDFDARPYSHLLPSLDRAIITVNDLLTLDVAEVAKRAQLPAGDLKKLVDAARTQLQQELRFGAQEDHSVASLSRLSNPAAPNGAFRGKHVGCGA